MDLDFDGFYGIFSNFKTDLRNKKRAINNVQLIDPAFSPLLGGLLEAFEGLDKGGFTGLVFADMAGDGVVPSVLAAEEGGVAVVIPAGDPDSFCLIFRDWIIFMASLS